MQKTPALIKQVGFSVLLVLLLSWAGAAVAGTVQAPQSPYPGIYSQPPRFQIFTAPNPYGGLLMVDTQTGESWQRVIVNTPKGITIRWIKLPKDKPIKEGESILWQ